MADEAENNPKKLTPRDIGIVLMVGEQILKAVRKAEENEKKELAKFNRMLWRGRR